MVRLAVRVQHHPSRAGLLPGLLDHLAGFADVDVVTDREGAGTWATHRACLRAMPSRATHLLVVQDDAVPCAAFARKARAAIKASPGRIVCLFTPGFGFLARRVDQARGEGRAVMEFPTVAFVPLVAVVYPAAQADGLLAFADGRTWPHVSRRSRADDGMVADYCRSRRIRPVATVPSLVDHDDTVPSVVKPSHPRGRHRRAALFAG